MFGTQQDSHRIGNIRRNPDVTVVIDTDQLPYKGVVIYGSAKLDYDNVIPKRVTIFQKYMPKENAEGLASGLAKLRKPVIIRVNPKKIILYDYAKDESGLFK